MKTHLSRASFWLAMAISVSLLQQATAQEAKPDAANPAVQNNPAQPAVTPGGAAAAQPKLPPFNEVLGDAETINGLLRLYKKGNRLFGEINPGQFDRDFIVAIAIAKGIGEGDLLGGMTWGFGDDWLWQFRKVDDSVYIVRRNVRFTADSGSPEAKAVSLAYTDSVLYSLPIVTMGPTGGPVIELTPVFMSDLPQIGRALPGFMFAGDRSTWAAVKGFANNVELEVAATYASGGGFQLDSVPDSRGATINVHYSISLLPQTGYQPRLADDRIGYFLTAIKDYSKKGDDERFVRYINRWDLRKKDPGAEVSEADKPIIFWMEKTIPYKYRKPIRDGILEWNKAFEKAGFYNAIQVRQQEEETFDPEDINYNTFRWITASAGFAMGPSRVNPATGQILDADIIFDADFIQFWKEEYEIFTPQSIAALTGGALDLKTYQEEIRNLPGGRHVCGPYCCDLHHGMARQFAFGSAAITAREAAAAAGPLEDKLIMQGLKEVTMHEVGHTLGLRHNFKSSSMYNLDELNDVNRTKDTGLTGSVMDYSPPNIVPKGAAQGDFYSSTIGPYDVWAIEYGYKTLPGGTPGEVPELQKVATRAAEPMLAYSTDEDTRGIDSDPLSNRFDLGNDPVGYARQRAKTIGELWPGLEQRVTKDGEGYQKARQAFGILLGNYGQAMHFASRNVGGLYVNRDHKADPNGRPPFVVVPADKQRDAVALLEELVFNDKPFQFPPELYNFMASSRWNHWGTSDPARLDYAVHDVIAMWQDRILSQLLSSLTLDRLHDSELKIPADQDAFTTAELVERLTKAIFAELDQLNQGEFTNRKPAVSSLRRNLQRIYLRRLSAMAMGQTGAPDDCQTVAFAELSALESRINAALQGQAKLDSYTRAHLTESASRIRKVIDAHLALSSP